MATNANASAEKKSEKYEEDSESSCGEQLDLESELSPEAFAALQLFMTQKQENARLPTASAEGWVSEDFGLSQFWYSVETAETIAREVNAAAAALHRKQRKGSGQCRQ